MQKPAQGYNLAGKLTELTKPVADLAEGLLASATYDGDLRLAVLKFYDAKAGRFWLWRDNTGHKPYCVEGDTLLLGDNKTIAQVCEGDQVLGLTGEVSVNGKVIRPYDGEIVRVHGCGLLPFSITPEHPVLVARSRGSRKGILSEFDVPRWKRAADIQPKLSREDGDYLVMPVAGPQYESNAIPLTDFNKMRSGWLKVKEFPINEETAWLLGLYVAEGSSGGRRGAVFSLSKDEVVVQDRIRNIAKSIGYSAYLVDNGKRSVRIHLGGAVMARAMDEWCGHGAKNKKIPDFILFHSSLSVLKSFLKGYTAGDGSIGTTRNTKTKKEIQEMVSVSKLLAFQLQQAYARLEIFAHITVQHAEGIYSIEGRKARQNEAYTVRFVKQPKFAHAKRVGEFFYVPIRKAETAKFKGTVYNIQTSDNTYLVNNIVVHNCYTKLPAEDLAEIRSRKDVIQIVDEEKLDLLADSKVIVRKIVTTDPLAIGGGNDSIRDKITAWEADIKYYENYAYDRGLKMGTFYTISKGEVKALKKEVPERVMRSLEEVSKKDAPEFVPFLKEWAELLGQPLTDFKRVALDIEVANEEGRLPDPEKATLPVIAVSFFGESERTVYALRRGGGGVANASALPYSLVIFDDEAEMLRAAFDKMMDYPVIITFNGDNFDLRYLKHRADNLKIGEAEDPIELQRVESSVKHGIHIDLYNFFKNRSIQVYAFSNKYTEHTLNGISEALIGKEKLEFEGEIGDLPLEELAKYCLNDSQLTYELTTMGGSVAMKLLLVIARIAKMPMNDVGRLGVSNWIRSMLFYEHRKINALIPRSDELTEKGGASSQAIIKGKKYKGGLVIEPKPGVFFDVSVLDFASLYPSLIKVYNLSYETVNCPHGECKSNTVPDTSHWVCTKRKGITSLVTGSLRDLRVGHYKQLARDPALGKDDRDLYNTVSQGLKVILNACFTGDTSIITPRGVKNIKDLRVGDKVVNVNPDTLRVEVDKVIEIQAFPYNGTVYHFNDGRFVDLIVTPNHRFLTVDKRKSSKSGVAFRTAEEVYNATNMTIPKLRGGVKDGSAPRRVSLLETAKLMGAYANFYPEKGIRLSSWFLKLPPHLRWKIREHGSVHKYLNRATNELQSHYRLDASLVAEEDIDMVEDAGGFVLLAERGFSKIPARYDVRDFASLCGWFVSEGYPNSSKSKTYANGHVRGRTAVVVISQEFGKGDGMGLRYRAEIGQLLGRLGLASIHDAADNRYYKVTSSILNKWMLTHCYEEDAESHDAHSKRVPDFVFQSRAAMESFFESAYKGDGSRRDARYSTVSIRLAQDMVVLLSYLGAKVKMTYDDGIYRVVFRNVSSKLTYAGSERLRHARAVPFDGMVYCVTTEKNHTVIAGRNGRFVHVGQSYGVMGFETFAFYCLPVAEATAALGRYAISKTIQKCTESGMNVLYGDTDSLFLQNITKDQITMVTRWADAELGVELDLDKTYRYVAFSSRKKNYFGVLPDGTADVKGLTGRKSQTPEFLKKLFYDTLGILSDVKSQPDFEMARSRIKELLGTTMNRLKNREIPVEQLAFNVMISKPTTRYNDNTPQHVKAAQLLERSGREIKGGDIISFVKTKAPPYVKPVQLAKAEDVDTDKYIEYAHSMFDQILDALDFSFDEIMGATTLDFFWSS